MFRVGTSKIIISPRSFPLPTSRGGAIEGICDGEDLHVRCIAIDNGERTVYIVCAELSGPANPFIIEERLQEMGIPRENVIMTGTHTHAVPPTDVGSRKMHEQFLKGPNNLPLVNQTDRAPGVEFGVKPTNEHTEAFKWLGIEKTLEAIKQSTQNMKPAKIGFGRGKSYININRDHLNEDGTWAEGPNPEGFSDKELSVLRFDDYDGHLIAAVLNYGCHCNTTYISKDIDGVRKVTCEFSGVACNYIEKRFGNDCVVMWTSGAGGDQNPIYNFIVPDYEPDGTWKLADPVPGATYQMMRALGKTHAIDAIKVLKSITDMDSELQIMAACSIDPLPTRKLPDGMSREEYKEKMRLAQLNGTPFLEMVPDAPREMFNQVVLLNDICLCGFACEAYARILYDLKQASPYPRTMCITHAGAPAGGYIQDEASRYNVVFQHFSGVNPVGITQKFIKLQHDRLKDASAEIQS